MSWLPYLFAMLKSPVLRGMLRELFELTRGNVRESERVLRRMKDRGYVLHDVEREVDQELADIDRQNEGK